MRALPPKSNGAGTVLAFSGGVGGAKLALGLAMALPPERLVIACNTGDDFEHLGLAISPDLDTVMYTLAGLSHSTQGWGLAGDSWRVMERLTALGGAAWFRLGDQDLATHLRRTQRLAEGAPLSRVTRELCEAFGVGPLILPATDDPVRTMVQTDEGELSFQHYFVREQCRPVTRGLRYAGSAAAAPQADVMALLRGGQLACIVICPSNPYLSIDPILSIAGMRGLLLERRVPVVAVSPLIAGKAVKGPTAKMMMELGEPVTAGAIAAHYRDLLDGLIIDEGDEAEADAVRAQGISVAIHSTMMQDLTDRQRLAREVLNFAATLSR